MWVPAQATAVGLASLSTRTEPVGHIPTLSAVPNLGYAGRPANLKNGMHTAAGPTSPLKPSAVADWLALAACRF